jgi:hypothetical protein
MSTGLSFVKPLLNQTMFRGSTQNNIVLFAGGSACAPQCGGEMEGGSVWIDSNAPLEERYKNLAKSQWPSQESGIHEWISPDGFRWSFRATWLVGRVDTQQVTHHPCGECHPPACSSCPLSTEFIERVHCERRIVAFSTGRFLGPGPCTAGVCPVHKGQHKQLPSLCAQTECQRPTWQQQLGLRQGRRAAVGFHRA